MMAPKYVSQVNLIRWSVVGITTGFQVYLMWKYRITWVDVVLWGIILSGAYTLVRISSVTEGMVQTVIKQEMYNKVKSMLFKDDERNTPDRFHKQCCFEDIDVLPTGFLTRNSSLMVLQYSTHIQCKKQIFPIKK